MNLTVTELAERWSAPRATVARWRDEGLLGSPVGERSRAFLYDVDEAARRLQYFGFLDENEQRLRTKPVVVRLFLRTRFEARYFPGVPGDCFTWTGSLSKEGYGQIHVFEGSGRRRTESTHVASWNHYVGPIPDGFEVDHLCRNRTCWNPDHLEPVPQRENWRRGQSHSAKAMRSETCPNGHVYDEANTYTKPNGWRRCRTCERQRDAARKRRRRDQRVR